MTIFIGYDSKLEYEVLGVMLNYHDDLLRAVTDLADEDFGTPLHRVIFKCLREISNITQTLPKPSEVVFHAPGAQDGLLELLIGLKEENIGLDIRYLISLMLSLREARKIFKFSEDTRKKFSSLQRSDYNQFVKNYSDQAFQHIQVPALKEETTITAYATQEMVYQRALENQQLRIEGKNIYQGIPTKYYELDRKMYGFSPGHLIVIGGRPGQGKTSLLLNLTANMSTSKVAIFSLEMTAEELVTKMILREARVRYSSYSRGVLESTDINKIYAAEKKLRDSVITIDDQSPLSPAHLYTKLLRFKQFYGVDIAYVDYLQLMDGNDRGYENNQVKIASISRALKSIAKELKIPIVALAQVNRSAATRADFRPVMSDLRESGAIEADADAVILVHRPSAYKDEKSNIKSNQEDLELIIAKNRFGECGSVFLRFDMETGDIVNAATKEQENESFSPFSPRKSG